MPLVENFVRYLRYEKQYSKHTITAYSKDIEQFFQFMSERYSIQLNKEENFSKMNFKMIRNWMAHQVQEKNTNRTVGRKLSAVKTFFSFLKKTNHLKTNVAELVSSPKIEKKLPSFVEQKSMKELFENVKFPETFDGIRDRAVLELLYSSGIRLSECIELKEKDVDFYNEQITVMGKRAKQRIIPFGKNAKESLLKYLTAVRQVKSERGKENFQKKSDVFFLTKKGEKMYPKAVYRLVNHYLSLASSASKKSPHVLRHTFATHLLDNGADLNAIKELLGHSSLSATEVYVHNTIDRLKKVYKQAHPKAGT